MNRSAAQLSSCREFPGEPRSVGRARHHVTRLLAGGDCEPLLDDAVLLVSELASNAVLHTRSGDAEGSFVLELEQTGKVLRVVVGDQGNGLPGPRPDRHVDQDEGGRGLQLVDLLAHCWGATRGPEGCRVWFELHPDR